MKLTPESHAHIESFLRIHLKDELLQLPSPSIHDGHFAGWLASTFRIGAITFGRHIFIAPNLVKRAEDGCLAVPGWLMTHEAVHVLQYEGEGIMRFLFSYLRGYWRALRKSEQWNMVAHWAAYREIPEERAAREAESAYRLWAATMPMIIIENEEENYLLLQSESFSEKCDIESPGGTS